MPLYLFYIRFLALLLCNGKRNYRVGLPYLSDFIEYHRGSAAVGAKTYRVVFVACQDFRAAGRAYIGKAVKGLFGLCVVAYIVVYILRVIAVLAVVADRPLSGNVESETRAATWTV